MKKAVLSIINDIRKNKGERALEAGEVSGSSRLRGDIGFDSFDLAELAVNVEEEFGIDVFESGVIETYGELCGKIDGK